MTAMKLAAVVVGVVLALGGEIAASRPSYAAQAEEATSAAAAVPDIDGKRRFWFNAQGLVREAAKLKIAQRRTFHSRGRKPHLKKGTT